VIDPEAYARLLCDWCLEAHAGQQVVIRSTTLAEPALLALQRELLARDAWPLLRTELPTQAEELLAHAHDAQLDGVPDAAVAETEAADAFLTIDAAANTRALAGIEPDRVARRARAMNRLREIRLSKRWAISLWPTAGMAQEAGMSLADYTDFVERALFLDRPDPVQAWRELSAMQDGLVERFEAAGEIHIEAEGTDLKLRVDGRTWRNSDGRRNMPSGEVFTGPHETSANGRVRFTIPTGPPGLAVSGVELELRDGEVVGARADRGDEHLQRALNTDAGARRLGELGVGTNFGIDRPTGSILLDEKIGGTIHLALGRSYPETGGTNESAVHWDLVCDLRDGGRLSADGEPVVQDGRIVTR
jgi:aminopeptidase